MSDLSQERCSLLIVSQDLEWTHAFNKGVSRFYLVEEKQLDVLDEIMIFLKDTRPDMVVLVADERLPSAEQLMGLLKTQTPPVPLMVVDSANEGMDKWVKQGAEYVCARRDILSAIRCVQQMMRMKIVVNEVHQTRQRSQNIYTLYDRLYQDLPDPICYVQDGLFLDANAAFLQVFGIKDKKALEDLTFMNFVPNKSERKIKEMLKSALSRDVVPSEQLELVSLEGGKIEVSVQVAKVDFNHEKSVQVYCRSTSAGGGGKGLDATTGLPDIGVLKSSLEQTIARLEDKKQPIGIWVYLWVENYREVWQKDGLRSAEILIAAVADLLRQVSPPSTEMSRFTDDGIVFWAQDDKESVMRRLDALIKKLDEIVPDDIGRLVHPKVFAGMQTVRADATVSDLVSSSYRAVRALAISQSGERVAEPSGSGEISRKDERRLAEVQAALDQQRIKTMYQPIIALEPDNVPRYALQLQFVPPADVEKYEAEDILTMLQTADRYGLLRKIDRFKINTFFQDMLSHGNYLQSLQGFIPISNDALGDETFAVWMSTQLKQTGIRPEQLTFELSVDQLFSNFSAAKRFIDVMRPMGANFAVTEVARYEEEIKDIFERIKPNVIKLDMREIDTFEDEEEQRFMESVKGYADANNAIIISDYMESPAQLSRVWPYDIKYLQGDGMVAPISGFEFDFSQPIF